LYLFEIEDTWDDIFNNLLEESEFKIHKTDIVSVTISDQLMGTTVFTVDMEEPIRVVKQFDSTLKYVLFTIVCVCGGEPKTYLPTYLPTLPF
jgi:hypothetical protein